MTFARCHCNRRQMERDERQLPNVDRSLASTMNVQLHDTTSAKRLGVLRCDAKQMKADEAAATTTITANGTKRTRMLVYIYIFDVVFHVNFCISMGSPIEYLGPSNARTPTLTVCDRKLEERKIIRFFLCVE